ncbi:hypothetical protein DPX39_060027600 [Trypanosoma brucei equiperdum]|uniref:Uncharacterized protein n=1 Tax=Trypanosoma brucei equiperdum TaxID=630700 RepID=A0A3L6L6F6_9TRYP|nr:hypothetical protein DPX39_060027600 [Trypanosoma brucei equiperdum]
MFRLDGCLMGRWSHRDFLRGRTKLGGSVHTRHTHGSRGRYKRLSSMYGLRDGRRHAWNHMHGGLGLKAGGGLFGLRIPRQHALSTLSKEEYDIALHGHPNITNPYRLYMDEHPDLESVMRNACLKVQLVLLMPRVRRTALQTNSLPPSWEDLLRHVGEALQGEMKFLGQSRGVTTHFATMSASSTCSCSASDALRAAAVSLFEDHVRGTKLKVQGSNLLRRGAKGKCSRFFGSALSNPCIPLSLSAPALKATALPSSTPPQLRSGIGAAKTEVAPSVFKLSEYHMDSTTPTKNSDTAATTITTKSAYHLTQRGVQQLLLDLRHDNPGALCMCLRLGEIIHNGEDLQECVGQQNGGGPKRKLLREDLDPDEVGVWKHPATSVDALMRWQYLNWDPRGHCADVLPHDKRVQTVCIFVDASRARCYGELPSTDTSDGAQRRVSRSLMTEQFSEKLLEMDYKCVESNDLVGALAGLKRWSVDYQWRAVDSRMRAAC